MIYNPRLKGCIDRFFGGNAGTPPDILPFLEGINALFEEDERFARERRGDEKQLRLLAQSVTSSTDCISITDLQDNILFVNKAFCDTYGYCAEELIGRHISIIRSSSMDPKTASEILPGCLAGGWSGVVINRRKDGTDFRLQLWASAVRDDDGQPFGYVGIARDLSEQTRIRRELDVTEQKYMVLFENANDAIIIFDPDDERIFEVNKKACEVYGYTRNEFLTMNLKSITKYVTRGEGLLHEISLKKIFRGFETVHLHKDGREIIFEGSASMIELAGRPAVMVILRDITDRRIVENRLRSSEERLWLISENINDFLVVIDSAGRIQFTTESLRLLGYDKTELVGSEFFGFVHYDDRNRFQGEFRHCMESYTHCSVNFRFLPKDGIPLPVEASLSLMVGDEESQVMITMRDVSERGRGEDVRQRKSV